MKKVLLVLSIFMLCACQYINSVGDYYIKNYLNKSYGEDKIFAFSEDGQCDLSQLGYCSAYYKASDLTEDVYVVWYDGDGMDIRDDYLFKKYKTDIKNYYQTFFSKTIRSNFSVEVLSQKSDMRWPKDAKPNDILNYEDLNLSLRINIASDDNDTTSLGEALKNLVNGRDVRNVASLYLISYNKGCNLNEVNKCKKVNSSYIEVKIVEDKQVEEKRQGKLDTEEPKLEDIKNE